MDEHEKILKEYGRKLGEILSRLFVSEAGLPRPIIGLKGDMPMVFPVNQDTVRELLDFAHDHKATFRPPALVFHVQLYKDPYHRKTLVVPHPYAELSTGEAIARLDDPRPVRLAKLVVPQVPEEWRTLKPLEVLLQAQANHVRHGVALGVGPIVPYRVPRQEIPGKATGI